MAATNVGLDWLEFLPSDDAQQLSAWACVRTRSDPERCESLLCMGHSQPSTQQAIRASGVGIKAPHIAPFPATRANVNARIVNEGWRKVGPSAPKAFRRMGAVWDSNAGYDCNAF
jgi:hypothetical protein